MIQLILLDLKHTRKIPEKKQNRAVDDQFFLKINRSISF
jgi:hypothetical protein